MMEKESPSNTPPGVFNTSCDGDIVKDMPNLASDDTRMPSNSFKSSYATSAADDNNSYSYTLTQAGNVCFVENNCEKESGDLLYYNWPDIGNFEDVDKMLRSCDSSFGIGVTDNDVELGWFSSDQIEGTEEALKMDFKFTCPEPSGLKNILHPDHDSSESNNHRSGCISESKDEFNFKDQTNLQNKQSKHQNQMEGKKTGHGIGSHDGSFYQASDLTGNGSRPSSNNTFDQVDQHHYSNLEIDYFDHVQSNTCYLHPDYPHQTTPVPMLSVGKPEHKGLLSTSPMGSSYASNQGRSTESSGDPSFVKAAAEVDEQKQSCNSQGFCPLYMYPPSTGNLSVKEHESESDIEGVQKGVEIDSLNVPESSSVSSELDEISLEATSFRQLRQVMEQLDLRSKLCIRDSLYRLARSAEQRHNDFGGPLMAERSNKCTGFMDIETDTNPIDRSVAHLLFHRPSESLKLPTQLPPKPNLNHGSIQGPSMLVCHDEAAAKSNDTIRGD